MIDTQRLTRFTAEHPHPLLFVSVSGAHLYGFPSADSDVDLRGVHITPLRQVLGLAGAVDTFKRDEIIDGLHLDLVTHDVRFFLRRLVSQSGNMLDQVYSPLLVAASAHHEPLRRITDDLLCREFAQHYEGLARSQWKRFSTQKEPQAKPLLYVYRSLLTGIHLMRSGEVISDVMRLNALFDLPYIPELVAQKREGGEFGVLSDADVGFHTGEYARLNAELLAAAENSHLPPTPPSAAVQATDSFLVNIRKKTSGGIP